MGTEERVTFIGDWRTVIGQGDEGNEDGEGRRGEREGVEKGCNVGTNAKMIQ